MGNVSKRNIEALGKVNFSAKVDFSVYGGLKIGEIRHIQHIKNIQYEEPYTDELNKIFNSVRLTKKQKELLKEFESEGGSEQNNPESDGFFTKVRDLWEDLKD